MASGKPCRPYLESLTLLECFKLGTKDMLDRNSHALPFADREFVAGRVVEERARGTVQNDMNMSN